MSKKHCKCLSRFSDHANGRTIYECSSCGRIHDDGAPDSPNNVLANLVNEAVQYPLHLRIATKMHLDGATSDEIDLQYLRTIVNEPILMAVINSMRNLENDLVDHEAYHRNGVRSLAKASENT